MQYYKLDSEVRKRLDKYFREANTFKSQSEEASISKQEGQFKP
jgi:hypothetical protein